MLSLGKVKHTVAVSTDREQAGEEREVGAGFRIVASVEGLEPPTWCLGRTRSIL